MCYICNILCLILNNSYINSYVIITYYRLQIKLVYSYILRSFCPA